jgi:WD40 repeat protein
VRVLEGHTGWVFAVAYSPDGSQIVSGSNDKSLRVWNAGTGEVVKVTKGQTDDVSAEACSPDGSHVAFGSDDHSLLVRDLATGGIVGIGHTSSVFAVAYSPDGSHIVSGSADQTVRVWNLLRMHNPRYIREENDDGQHTGWLLSPNDPSNYLMFVPPAALLPDDANVLTLPTSATPHVDLSNAKLGREWAACYTPTA